MSFISFFKMCWKIPGAKRQNSCPAFNSCKSLNLEMKKCISSTPLAGYYDKNTHSFA